MRPFGRRKPSLWALGLLVAGSIQNVEAVGKKEQRRLQEETRALWNHGFTNYMAFAYPEDELKPLSCRGQGRDHANPGNYGRNDVNGDYSLTFLDLLSTMPLIRGEAEFEKAIDRVLSDIKNFDRDVKVQVFEVTIRILGSLLSSYQQLVEIEERRYLARRSSSSLNGWRTPLHVQTSEFLSSVIDGSLFSRKALTAEEDDRSLQVESDRRQTPRRLALADYEPSNRAQRLLALAKDLGDRLLPAFDSPTGLPFARINLRTGLDRDETEETCAAATGSLTLEFTVLSRLTGNPVYERVARESFMNTWSRRAPTTGLLGNSIGVRHGHWMMPGASGIGAGIDSFYEYALKGAILFDDDAYMGVWDDSYRSVMQHVRSPDLHLFRNVYMSNGRPVGALLDSLSAFWPGLQVVAGDVENAIKSHLLYWHLWQKHSSLPEGFDYVNKTVLWSGYPLRPEFIESTYWLYRATKDSFYLEVGKRILKDLTKRTKVRCGFAVLHNLHTGAKEDRMESFMLSETLKYLYLLFDEKNPINTGLEGTVFTTEGHILKLPRASRAQVAQNELAGRQYEFAGSSATCDVPPTATLGGLRVSIKSREDYDYARTLVDMPLMEKDYWDLWGFCRVPQPGFHHFEIVLTANNESAPATPKTVSDKEAAQSRWDAQITRFSGDLVVSDAKDIRALLTRTSDGAAFEVTSVGNHRVHPGQYVYIQDPLVLASIAQEDEAPNTASGWEGGDGGQDRFAEIGVRLSSRPIGREVAEEEAHVIWEGLGATATFGRQIVVEPVSQGESQSSLLGVSLEPLPLAAPRRHYLGCTSDAYSGQAAPFVAFPQRGVCTFREKMVAARQAGATGVVVWGNDEDTLLIRPADDSAYEPVYPNSDLGDADDDQIAMLYVPKQAGLEVTAAESRGDAVYVEVTAYPGELQDVETAISDALAGVGGTVKSIIGDNEADWQDVMSALSDIFGEAGIRLDQEGGGEGDLVGRGLPIEAGRQLEGRESTGVPDAKEPRLGDEQDAGTTFGSGRKRRAHEPDRFRRDQGPPPLMIAGLPIRNMVLQQAPSG